MRYLLLLSIVFLLWACAGSRNDQILYEYDSADEGGTYEMSMSRSFDGVAGGRIRAAKASSMESMELAAGNSIAPMPASAPRQERMVNYTGNINMQSATPEAVIDTVVERAKAKGGSVTNRRNGYVSLQIPVAEFKNFFNQILTLGRVTSKNISASDITEAYADNAARLKIAESTLSRLQHLLAAARTEQEKIALLKEIQRVSEQIEQRKLEEKELLRLAAFSTINLWVGNIPTAITSKANIRAFEWFSGLPNMNFIPNEKKALKLSVPKDFIETADTRREWSAASALNAKFQAFEWENEPQGSILFWAEAMLESFKTRYSTELKIEENFALIRLQSFGAVPEVHYIALLRKSDRKTLRIAVAYFPNIEVEKKNSETVLEVLRGVK
ncbi:MAG: DUF4349 domain-containing protein [Fibromonadaceae bacterium]|nr:DUF4349 domain-containing protein [Fibromonadaceae bacterium]